MTRSIASTPAALLSSTETNKTSQATSLQNLARRQILHQSPVGLEKVVIHQLVAPHPAHIPKNPVLNLALKLADEKELQLHTMATAIAMPHPRHLVADAGGDAELFLKFAHERLPRALAALDLAAGKLPFERHRLVLGALADEQLVVAHHERRHHAAHFDRSHPARRALHATAAGDAVSR